MSLTVSQVVDAISREYDVPPTTKTTEIVCWVMNQHHLELSGVLSPRERESNVDNHIRMLMKTGHHQCVAVLQEADTFCKGIRMFKNMPARDAGDA